MYEFAQKTGNEQALCTIIKHYKVYLTSRGISKTTQNCQIGVLYNNKSMKPKKPKAKRFCQACPYTATCSQICPQLERELRKCTEDPRKKRIEIEYMHEMSATQASQLEQILYGEPTIRIINDWIESN